MMKVLLMVALVDILMGIWYQSIVRILGRGYLYLFLVLHFSKDVSQQLSKKRIGLKLLLKAESLIFSPLNQLIQSPLTNIYSLTLGLKSPIPLPLVLL